MTYQERLKGFIEQLRSNTDYVEISLHLDAYERAGIIGLSFYTGPVRLSFFVEKSIYDSGVPPKVQTLQFSDFAFNEFPSGPFDRDSILGCIKDRTGIFRKD